MPGVRCLGKRCAVNPTVVSPIPRKLSRLSFRECDRSTKRKTIISEQSSDSFSTKVSRRAHTRRVVVLQSVSWRSFSVSPAGAASRLSEGVQWITCHRDPDGARCAMSLWPVCTCSVIFGVIDIGLIPTVVICLSQNIRCGYGSQTHRVRRSLSLKAVCG